MNTFIKTFVICLILCVGFIGYKCFNDDSYSPIIHTNNENSVFSFQKKDDENIDEKTEENIPPKEIEPQATEVKAITYNCYFYSPQGKLVPMKRELASPQSVETAITLLLKGPLAAEAIKGYHSEIPMGTALISVKKSDKKIIVDLNSKFGEGGGSQSIENRISQLSKTIKAIEPNKSIYLYINGKEVEYLGGDGVYVKQPL